ncbi:hypothetical protein VTI74DRAFT_1413 [Chaetomium olivicolor]
MQWLPWPTASGGISQEGASRFALNNRAAATANSATKAGRNAAAWRAWTAQRLTTYQYLSTNGAYRPWSVSRGRTNRIAARRVESVPPFPSAHLQMCQDVAARVGEAGHHMLLIHSVEECFEGCRGARAIVQGILVGHPSACTAGCRAALCLRD